MSPHHNLDQQRLDLIWGRTPPRGRGPRPSLTVERIARAAIELADAAGLEAVSMKRLAEALEVGTMTLYTYVPDKTTLLQLMLDRAVGTADRPDPSADWRQHLRQSAEALVRLYQVHPWMMQINIDGPPMTPNQMRFLESTLKALHSTGLSRRESLDIALSLASFALGAAKLSSDILRAEHTSPLRPDELRAERTEMFRRLLDPEEFPMVLEAMTAPTSERASQDLWDSLGFRFGLDRLIDGVAAHIEARTAPCG